MQSRGRQFYRVHAMASGRFGEERFGTSLAEISDMAFGVARQQPPRGSQRAVVTNRGENIAKFTLSSRGIRDTIGRE